MSQENENENENENHMSDEEWSTWLLKIADDAFMTNANTVALGEADEDYAESLEMIEMYIARGNNPKRAHKRKTFKTQIMGEGRKLDGWPIKKGKESSLPIEVQQSRDTVAELVEAAYIDFWNNNPIIQQICVISDRNKELGGSPFPSAEEFASTKAVAAKQRVVKLYNEQDADNNRRWDGLYSPEDGLTFAPPFAEQTDDSGDDSDD